MGAKVPLRRARFTDAQGRSMSALPGRPGPKLRAAWEAMSQERREAFLPHLLGGTSANWLSNWLTRAGTPVGATTIKDYRRTAA